MQRVPKPLVLQIGEDGSTTLSVGGLVIELVEELRIEVSGNLKPRIKISFASTLGLPKNPTKFKILELLHRYREIVEEHPCIEVYDTAETMPFLKAVRPSNKPDPETKG